MRPALATVILATSGCVAVPFVSPPIQLETGAGGRSVSISGQPARADYVAQVRVGVHPLGLVPDMVQRRGDVGLGYFVDYSETLTVHGPYLEGGLKLFQHPLGEGLGRVVLHGQARLARAGGSWGAGGAVQLSWAWAFFEDHDFDSKNPDAHIFGHAYGETGVGVFVEGSYMRAGNVQVWGVSGGLLLHVPASYGVAEVWLWTILRAVSGG